MYITQIELDLRNHLIFKKLRSLDDYHAYIESAFPAEQLLGVRKRHLWRLDGQTILIASEDEPDKEALGKYGKVTTKSYDKFLDNISTERPYQFRLVANPLQMGIKDRRIPCHGNNERLEWLEKQGKRYGFKVIQAQVTGYKENKIRKHGFTVKSVVFEGVLQITDTKKFKQALKQGIGREKAYGCGLMTIM